jgi:hypothetical protein
MPSLLCILLWGLRPPATSSSSLRVYSGRPAGLEAGTEVTSGPLNPTCTKSPPLCSSGASVSLQRSGTSTCHGFCPWGRATLVFRIPGGSRQSRIQCVAVFPTLRLEVPKTGSAPPCRAQSGTLSQIVLPSPGENEGLPAFFRPHLLPCAGILKRLTAWVPTPSPFWARAQSATSRHPFPMWLLIGY